MSEESLMEFYKDTIMGQVLSQVQSDKNNEHYFDQIDALLEDIANMEYLETNTPRWHQKGVVVTNRELSNREKESEWVYVETADVTEYSWLIERLLEIYNPSVTDTYRLLTTIGFLLNVYGERHDDLSDIFRIVTVTSTVFLHPDHLGLDKFKVQAISLPPFGREF